MPIMMADRDGIYYETGCVPMQVYKPLKDKYLNELFQRIRSRFGGYNVPKHSTAREIIKLKAMKAKRWLSV